MKKVFSKYSPPPRTSELGCLFMMPFRWYVRIPSFIFHSCVGVRGIGEWKGAEVEYIAKKAFSHFEIGFSALQTREGLARGRPRKLSSKHYFALVLIVNISKYSNCRHNKTIKLSNYNKNNAVICVWFGFFCSCLSSCGKEKGKKQLFFFLFV